MKLAIDMLVLLFVLLYMSLRQDGAFALRTIESGQKDAAVELNADTFNSSLLAAPASWAMVEFYAHWCPACRNYKTHYERVARLFNGQSAIHPGFVYMAKIDCAQKINTKVCDKFSVHHYPTLLWGPPSKFLSVGSISDTTGGLEAVEIARTAESLLQWINKKVGKDFNLEDLSSQYGLNEDGGFDSTQVAVSLYDIEEATAIAMEIILGTKLLNQKTRSSFIQFLQLLLVSHPSKRCRKGAGEILMNMEAIWPSLPVQADGNFHAHGGLLDSSSLPDYETLKLFGVCGAGVPRGYWMFCRGSLNDTRGYSCGLWLLFHSLSVRVDDNLAYEAFETICNFVAAFFNCKECKEHFTPLCKSEKWNIVSRHDLVIWLFHAHNEVNERVGKEEVALGTGDPKFPKIIWPSKKLCGLCRSGYSNKRINDSIGPSFNEKEVYPFLLKFYGYTLNRPSNESDLVRVSDVRQNDGARHSLAEVSTSSAVAVPFVAAICIAFASCGFGAMACYWRMQQKKLKRMRRRN